MLAIESYDASLREPLNCPPHQLTRWQVSSIQSLAVRVGVSLQLIMPLADGFVFRVLRSLLLRAVLPSANLGRRQKLALFVIIHPWQPFVDVSRQLRRRRLKGRVQPDVVLACLGMDGASNEV
jgi:hypothetical protein